ncbi:MAG: carboxylesterase family protein, partial [Firmicutes bacterium]|nr:carboxylesterase family protein [Bacillota bacterium]
TYSEDCLFLNVFTPDTAREGDQLPVLVYIHGGGFTGGCGHEKHFDGPVWPLEGIIGVTLNYRLGPLGFACLPQLKEEAGYTGNYGLYDQLTAIQWVKDNISAFGGDPENITIMGQSAGAMSVQQHCLSPLSEGMFQRAVMSSGGGVHPVLSAAPAEKTYAFWQTVMEKAGCSTLEEFRALPPEALFALWQETRKDVKGGSCFPVVDGRLVVGSGTQILAEGKQKHISYMAGSTSEDMMPPILLGMARKWCSAQKTPGYTWYFNRQLPGDDNGAWHSSDLWYWFGTLENCWRPMEQKDYDLSAQMVRYLCNFVRTGDPNGSAAAFEQNTRVSGDPLWEPSAAGSKKVFCLGEEPAAMGKPSLLKMIHTMLTNKAVGE